MLEHSGCILLEGCIGRLGGHDSSKRVEFSRYETECAFGWLEKQDPNKPLLIVAPSLEAGSRLIREFVQQRNITAFGWQRVTPQLLYSTLAANDLDARGLAVVGGLTRQALIGRVLHDIGAGATWSYQDAAKMPGLPKALARTIAELRLSA